MGVQTNQSLPSEGRTLRKRKASPQSQPKPSSASGAACGSASASASASAYAPAQASSSSPAKRFKREQVPATGGTKDVEGRLRRFRDHAPQAFFAVYERATSQRFFVLSRTRCGTDDCPEETVELAGSTGNIYNVHVSRVPTCDCPHARKGNQCKHLLYVMSRVLRARFDLVYQLALLSCELREIFAKAPAAQQPLDAQAGPDQALDKRRKPVEGDCPICFDELPATADGSDQLVWCRAACGQNMHRQCFQMWSATKRQQAGGTAQATCPFCRSLWGGDTDQDLARSIKRDGPVNDEGYVNVADQLGISQVRDDSSYSHWWDSPAYRGRRLRRSHW